METEEELNNKILSLTLHIRENHKELCKFLNEMPVTIPDEASPEVTRKSLTDYYESLKDLLRKYKLDHPSL